MSQRIAVPVDEEGVLDGHFGHCKFFILFDIEDGKIVKEDKVVPPPHEPGLLPKWLGEKEVTDIISGGMGQLAIDILKESGVNAHVGAPNMQAKDLVEQFLASKLEFSGNGCDH